MGRLTPQTTLLMVVDVQEKLAAAMDPPSLAALERSLAVLLEAAELLRCPVLASEQYPKGLGPTLPAVRERLGRLNAPVLEKMEFSVCEAKGFAAAWEGPGIPRAVVVVGMETHVCVYQTVRELLARGVDVHVPIDGVASRRPDHRDAGLGLMRGLGAQLTTTETVVFDWLERAGTEEFKRLSKLIR